MPPALLRLSYHARRPSPHRARAHVSLRPTPLARAAASALHNSMFRTEHPIEPALRAGPKSMFKALLTRNRVYIASPGTAAAQPAGCTNSCSVRNTKLCTRTVGARAGFPVTPERILGFQRRLDAPQERQNGAAPRATTVSCTGHDRGRGNPSRKCCRCLGAACERLSVCAPTGSVVSGRRRAGRDWQRRREDSSDPPSWRDHAARVGWRAPPRAVDNRRRRGRVVEEQDAPTIEGPTSARRKNSFRVVIVVSRPGGGGDSLLCLDRRICG